MSNIFSQISKEAQKQKEQIAPVKEVSKDNPNTDNKTIIDDSKIASTRASKSANNDIDQDINKTMLRVIEGVHGLPESYKQQLVRMSKEEVDMINSFIDDNFNIRQYIHNSITLTKLMRYAIIFVLTQYKGEFKKALHKTLKKEIKTDIFDN